MIPRTIKCNLCNGTMEWSDTAEAWICHDALSKGCANWEGYQGD